MISTTVSSIHVLLCITVLASDTSLISIPHHNLVLPPSYHYTKLITYIRWLWTNTLRRDMGRPFTCFPPLASFSSFFSFGLLFYTLFSLFRLLDHYARTIFMHPHPPFITPGAAAILTHSIYHQ